MSWGGRAVGGAVLVAAVTGAVAFGAWQRQACPGLLGAFFTPGPGQGGPTGAGAADMAEMPGRVDIGFAQDMSLHHEQAIVMARLAMSRGSPLVHAQAETMLSQQLQEIGTMQGWLMWWKAAKTSQADDMPWMKESYRQLKQRDEEYEQFIASCQPGRGMPGMASAEELDKLSSLRLNAFDRLFLAFMIRHHQGALVMARFAAEQAASSTVREFARSILVEQRQEMMQLMMLLRQAASP